MAKRRDPEIVLLPDHGQVTFDEHRTPILTYSDTHAGHGAGWVLYYLDDQGAVEEYFIGGAVEDMDWALGCARDALDRIQEA